MPSLFRKLAAAFARPFTKHLRADLKEMSTRLVEHSRYTADNLELLCSLQKALGEKQDALSAKLDAFGLLQTALHEKQDLSLRRIIFPLDAQRALVQTAFGYMICDRTAAPLLGTLLESGDVEPGLRRFMKRYLKEGMTFVDVGAHIGMHTIPAAQYVGKKGRVIAFEPTPATAEWLRQNVFQNGLGDQTTVHSCCVGASSGVTAFHLSRINGHNSKFRLPDETATIEVQLVALDEVLREVGAVDLFKIDVEGAEVEVFAGMHEILRRSPDACVVAKFAAVHLERSGTSVGDWNTFCAEHEFAVYVVKEPDGTLRKTSFVDLMSEQTTNVLMARDYRLEKHL